MYKRAVLPNKEIVDSGGVRYFLYSHMRVAYGKAFDEQGQGLILNVLPSNLRIGILRVLL